MKYSYKGQNPDRLPFRIRLDDGTTRTSLDELSKEELNSIGFFGPIDVPLFDEKLEKLIWDGEKYLVENLTEEEIIYNKEKELVEIRKNINYSDFWNELQDTKFYKKVFGEARKSLEVNTICTEIVSLFTDAKYGICDEKKIQNYFIILFFILNFSEEEILEMKAVMEKNNLNKIYRLPIENEDEDYFILNTYDPETNTIISSKPYDSWILENGKWKSPVPYPADGQMYQWDESILNWKLIS